jgi:hypothetical protein
VRFFKETSIFSKNFLKHSNIKFNFKKSSSGSRIVPCGQTDGRRHMNKLPKIDSKSQNRPTPTITAQLNYQQSQTVTGVRPASKQQQRVRLASNVPKGTAVYLFQTYLLVKAPKGCGLRNSETDTSRWKACQAPSNSGRVKIIGLSDHGS